MGWARRWPLFAVEGQPPVPHPILAFRDHPRGLLCFGITHSADLFDHGGSIRLSPTANPELYPPLIDLSLPGRPDHCVIGILNRGLPAHLACVFSGNDIINLDGGPIPTSDWREIPPPTWTRLQALIKDIAARSRP
jgi:hypothetical protein